MWIFNVFVFYSARTTSCQTFDSLDFGGSEDGDHQEKDRVAGVFCGLYLLILYHKFNLNHYSFKTDKITLKSIVILQMQK